MTIYYCYCHRHCHLPNRSYLFVAGCCTDHTPPDSYLHTTKRITLILFINLKNDYYQKNSYMNLCTQTGKDLSESVDPHSRHSLYQANTFIRQINKIIIIKRIIKIFESKRSPTFDSIRLECCQIGLFLSIAQTSNIKMLTKLTLHRMGSNKQ